MHARIHSNGESKLITIWYSQLASYHRFTIFVVKIFSHNYKKRYENYFDENNYLFHTNITKNIFVYVSKYENIFT